MRIYRIELTTGGGPYNPESCDCLGECECNAAERAHLSVRIAAEHCGSKWPTTYADEVMDGSAYSLREALLNRTGGREKAMWRHGFDSHYTLAEWFSGWAVELQKAGYVVSTYDVPPKEVIRGMAQVVFNPKAATLIDLQYPTEVFW